MSLRTCSFVALIAAAGVIVGCENRPQPVSPSTIDNAPAAQSAGPAQLAVKGPSQHVVTLFDACDPETFNAAGVAARRAGAKARARGRVVSGSTRSSNSSGGTTRSAPGTSLPPR